MSHQRYQPRSLMMPSRALRTSPPPPSNTIVPGRVRTAPNPHPMIPRGSPRPTSHQRRRRLRAIVSRSLSRCSSPVASSFQPRTRDASEPRPCSVSGSVTRNILHQWFGEGENPAAPGAWRAAQRDDEQSRRGVAQSELRRGDQHLHPVAGRLERGAPPFLAVHHGEHAQHAPPFALDRPDRLQRGLASGDHVFHDHRRGAGGEASLDALSRAVGLGLLADGEGVECSPSCRAGRSDGAGDGVSAEREPAHQLGPPPGGREPREGEGPDHRKAFGRHGRAASVDVEARAAAGGEQKVAALERAGAQQVAQTLFEGRSRVHTERGCSTCYYYLRSRRRPTARLRASSSPPPLGAGPAAIPASTSAANAVTVGCRWAGSRASPRITAAWSAAGNSSPTTAWFNGTGAAVSSCWNSSRGVRPVYGWTPVRSQYVIVARLKMSARPSTSSPDRASGATYWSVPTKNPVRVSRSSAGSSASRAIPKSSSLTRSVAVS